MRGTVVFGVGVTALFLGILPNCSSGSESGAGSSCSRYYDALIGYYQRCNFAGEATPFASTRDRFLTVCSNALAAPGAGSVGDAISTCANKISSATCGEDPDCEIETNGTLPDGAACLENFQCASGGCDSKDDQCGKCVPRPKEGEPCSTAIPCGRNLSCSYTNGTEGTCRARVVYQAGQACAGADVAPGECADGLRCSYGAGGTSTAPVCAAPVGAGGKCSSSSDCTDDLSCREGTCQAGAQEGASCKSFGDDCARGLVCDASVCKKFVFVKAGQACDLVRQCERGPCKGLQITSSSGGGDPVVTPGTCEDPLPDGSPCQNPDDVQPGEGAEEPPRCDTFAECINGTCQIPNPANCK